jgi:hypothetical protein
MRVPFVIEVRGTFHQLMRYFWMLHEHANEGRIITVEDFGLSEPTPGSNGIVMTAKFTAVGFREPDAAAGAAADSGDAQPKGGKGQVRDATQRRDAQVEAAAASDAPAAGGPGAAAEVPPAAPPAGDAPAAAAPADKSQPGIDRLTKPEGP